MARAYFIDERPEEDEGTEPVAETQETEEQPQEGQEPGEPQEPAAEELPEKYRGKTPAEIVQMHQEAERLLGRQSSEVGELRKVVDDFIKTQTELDTGQTQPKQEEPEDDYDFFTDPEKAINRAVDNHPDVKAARELNRDYKKTTTMAALQKKHPDMVDIVQSEGFHNWLRDSKYRQELFQKADQDYEYEAADELFSTWKAINAQKVAEAEVKPEPDAKEVQRKKLQEANTGNARGSGERPGKKIYRRTDIIKLMKNDPERYRSLESEIRQAYAEGRVR